VRAVRRGVQLFTGKGGVGKSTLVAASALEAAGQGHRPLVVELGHRASIGAILGGGPIGHEPAEVVPGVFATAVAPEPALVEHLAEHVKVRGIARRIAASRTLRRFFEAAPAVVEALTLARLSALARLREGEQARFHPILVDLDSTGHALMFLELPRVLGEIAKAGPLRAIVDRSTALLQDEGTCLHVVTLPAELVVQETVELCRQITERGTVRAGALLVNQVPPLPIEPAALDRLQRHARAERDAVLLGEVALGTQALDRHRRARACIDAVGREVTLPRIELPLLAEVSGAELRKLGAALAPALEGP
jgi:anion-transporting  ArsA/GET3 family ATPase